MGRKLRLTLLAGVCASALLVAQPETVDPRRSLQRGLELMSRSLESSESEQNSADIVFDNIAKGFGATVSAGYLAWLLRMGPLLVSVFSTMPMWTRFDPLPVVLAPRDDEEDEPIDEHEASAGRILDSGKDDKDLGAAT